MTSFLEDPASLVSNVHSHYARAQHRKLTEHYEKNMVRRDIGNRKQSSGRVVSHVFTNSRGWTNTLKARVARIVS